MPDSSQGFDFEDPSPTRLVPQVAGADVDATSLFGLGITTVTFRFRDIAGNIGTATATVTVNAPNRAPVAKDDSYFTNQDTKLTGWRNDSANSRSATQRQALGGSGGWSFMR